MKFFDMTTNPAGRYPNRLLSVTALSLFLLAGFSAKCTDFDLEKTVKETVEEELKPASSDNGANNDCRIHTSSLYNDAAAVFDSCTFSLKDHTRTCSSSSGEQATYVYASVQTFIDEGKVPFISRFVTEERASYTVVNSFNGARITAANFTDGRRYAYSTWDDRNRPTAASFSNTTGCDSQDITIEYDNTEITRTTTYAAGTESVAGQCFDEQTVVDTANANGQIIKTITTLTASSLETTALVDILDTEKICSKDELPADETPAESGRIFVSFSAIATPGTAATGSPFEARAYSGNILVGVTEASAALADDGSGTALIGSSVLKIPDATGVASTDDAELEAGTYELFTRVDIDNNGWGTTDKGAVLTAAVNGDRIVTVDDTTLLGWNLLITPQVNVSGSTDWNTNDTFCSFIRLGGTYNGSHHLFSTNAAAASFSDGVTVSGDSVVIQANYDIYCFVDADAGATPTSADLEGRISSIKLDGVAPAELTVTEIP